MIDDRVSSEISGKWRDPDRPLVVETSIRIALANPTWTMLSCVRAARRMIASAVVACERTLDEPIRTDITTAAIPVQPL